MPEYTSELYNWINSVDNTFSKDISLDSFKSKMSDQAYAKKMYDWVSKNDKTFKNDMSFDAFYAKANSGKKKVSASGGVQKQQPTSSGGTATQRSQSSATSGKGDGIYKLGTNDKATYKKEGGQWYVDWNSNGNFMPLKKGDVQARVKNLEANAQINIDLTGSYMPNRAEQISKDFQASADELSSLGNTITFGSDLSKRAQKTAEESAAAVNEKVFTGLKGKEENLYRIQNGNWQRKTPASNGKYSEWSDVTNEQAIKILNTNFKQNVGFEAAKAAQEIEKTKHRYADVTSKLIDHQEKRVVSYLTDRYASRGFTFEETGMGDFMIVRSKLPGVAPLRVSLDNWTSGDDVQQAKNLREYLIENEYTPEKAKELEFAQKISETSGNTFEEDPNLRRDPLSESTNVEIKNTLENTPDLKRTTENILKIKEVESKYGIKADDLISKVSAKANIYKATGKDVAAGEVAKSKIFNIASQRTAEYEMSQKVMINAAEELKAKVDEFKSNAANMTEEDASAMAEEISVMQENLQRMMDDSEYEADEVRDLVESQVKMKIASDKSKEKQGTGAGSIARTVTDAVIDGAVGIVNLAVEGDVIDADLRNKIKDGVASAYTGTTQEFKNSEDRSTLNKIVQSVVEMATVTLTGGAVAGGIAAESKAASSLTNSLLWFGLTKNRTYDSISKEVPDMPDEEKEMLSTVIGAVVGSLEKYGVDSVASSKVAQNYVTKSLPRILADLPQDASLDMVQKAISADIKKVMIQRGMSGATKMFTEGATEATQTFAEAGIKEVYDAIKGKDFFKQDWGTVGMNAVNDFVLGAAAGGIVNSMTSLPSTATELRSAKNYGVTKEVINDPELLAILKNDMRVRVANGEITKFEAQQKMHALREVKMLSGKVPQGLTVDQEQKAVELIAEKEQLTKEIEGKEPNLVVSKAERINEINEQLKTISTDAVQEQIAAEGSELGSQEEVTIDKPTVAMNAQVELDRVKQADIASEDGATLNLDGTKYDGGGLVVPVASMNTTVEEITPDMIADFVEENSGKIGDQNTVKVGVYKFPGSNEMSIDLNVVVPESSREQAIEFGRQADQESLFDLGTFENVKTGGTGKNPAQFTDAQFKEIAKALNEGRVPNVFTKVNPEIEQAREAISKIGGPEVIVFNTQEEYQQALADAAGIPLSAIQLEEKENRTDGQQIGDKVFIDASNPNASSTTVFHEAAHWALTKTGVSQEDMASFVDAIRKVAKDKNLVDYLDRFSTQAEYVETGQSQEEFLVELMGRLAADKDGALSTTNYQRVLNAINKLLESIGMKPIFKSTASRQEVVDFVNRMAKGLREGDATIFNELENSLVSENASSTIVAPMGIGSERTIDTTEVNQKRNKRISQFAEDKLTDDGKGNYVFHHWSQQRRDKIKPGTGQNIITGRGEASAMSAVGGLAQYYTMADQAEPGTGSVLHTVLVPKEKVYDFNLDPEGWYQEAKYRFDQARPGQAFGANEQLAFVTQIANENGYDMVVAKWRNGTELRAQTTLELTPEVGNVDMKPREDDVPEIGDDVIVSGSEAKVTDVVGDFFDYKGEGVSGRINYVKNKRLWRKKRISPTKNAAISQAMENYKLSMSRAGDKAAARKAALADLKKNDWWTNASDVDREAALRELRSKLGLKEVPAAKTKREGNDVTVDEYDALVSVIKREAKAARDKKKQMKEVMQTITEYVRDQLKKKKILPRQASAIMGKVNSTNFDSKKSIDALFDYVDNVASDAAYMEKLSKASQLRKALSRRSKNGRNPIAKFAKTFSMLNPKYVKDIDLYLGVARMLNSSLDRSAVDTKTSEVKWKKEYSIEQMADYLEQELKNHAEIELQKLKNRYEKLTGNSSANMSADQIQEALRKTPAPVADVTDEIKERLEELKQSVDDDAPQSVKDAANIDPTIVDNRLALDIIDAIDSYLVNGLPGGIDKIMARYEALKSLSRADFKAKPIRTFGSKVAGSFNTEYLTNINMMIERMFRGVGEASKFMKLSGWNGIVNGVAKANRDAADKVKQYTDRYRNIKDFDSVENIFERGAIAFLSRTNSQENEFQKRVSLLIQSVDALRKGNEVDKATADVYEKVLNKLGVNENTESIDDVFKNAEEFNKSAVKWITSMWADVYGDFKDFSLSMRNTMLAQDVNYTPDRFATIEGAREDVGEEDYSAAHAYSKYNNIILNKNEAGVFVERTGPAKLPKNSFISLDFDSNNMRSYKLALIDMNTAKSIYQMQEFVNSDQFNEIVPDADDRKLFANVINQYVNGVKGKSKIDVTSLSNVSRIMNVIAGFGAARALAGASQAVSQYSTALINAVVNAGPTNIDLSAPFNSKINDFINRSGTATANRGIDSMSSLPKADELSAKAAKTVAAGKIVDGLEQLNKVNTFFLKWTLAKPDVAAARTAWWAYYKKYCNKNGIEIDLSGEVNKDAASYAQQMVDRNMDVSDTELKGQLFKSTDGLGAIVKNIFFPFASFAMNMKQRMWIDMAVLSSKNTSSEDRNTAVRSLASVFAEMAVYNGIRYAVATSILEGAMALLDLDDEEKEQYREKLNKQSLENVFSKAIEDLLSPSPLTNDVTITGINKILDAMDFGVKKSDVKKAVDEVNKKREEDGKERMTKFEEDLFVQNYITKNQFQFYVSDSKSAGMYGIQLLKLLETYDLIDMYATGEFEKEGFGGTVSRKKISEEGRKQLLAPLIMKAGAQFTIREFDALSNKMVKIIKDRSGLTEKQMNTHDELKKAGVKIDKAIMRKIKDGASVETIIDFDSYYANWTEAERLKAIEEEKGQ